MTESEIKEQEPNQPDMKEKFSVKNYLILNAVVWAFCIIEIGLIYFKFRGPDGEVRMEGALVFFTIIGVVFSLISVCDFLYDRIFPEDSEEEYLTQSEE